MRIIESKSLAGRLIVHHKAEVTKREGSPKLAALTQEQVGAMWPISVFPSSGTPLNNDERIYNRRACIRCPHANDRTCSLDGVDCFTHSDTGVCPQDLLPTFVNIDGGDLSLSIGKPMPKQKTVANPTNHFSHSGKYGDLIYALPAIRALGGGVVWLNPNYKHVSGLIFDEKDLNSLRPLLIEQPYIEDVRLADFNDKSGKIDMDLFRTKWIRNKPITTCVLRYFDLPEKLGYERFLHVPPAKRVARYVINLSPRYRTEGAFDWSEIVRRYRDESVFIGLKSEHEDFVGKYGEIKYHRTRDMLEAAQVINESEWFLGNSSSCLAICQGLRHPCIIDHWQKDDCSFRMPEQIIGWDAYFKWSENVG